MVIYTVQYKSQVNSGIHNLMFVISSYIFLWFVTENVEEFMLLGKLVFFLKFNSA